MCPLKWELLRGTYSRYKYFLTENPFQGALCTVVFTLKPPPPYISIHKIFFFLPLHLPKECSFFPGSLTPKCWTRPKWRQSSRSCNLLVWAPLANLHQNLQPSICGESSNVKYKDVRHRQHTYHLTTWAKNKFWQRQTARPKGPLLLS